MERPLCRTNYKLTSFMLHSSLPAGDCMGAEELGTEGFIPAWSPLELDEKVHKVSHKGKGRPLNIRGRTEVDVCWGNGGLTSPRSWNPSSPGGGGTERGIKCRYFLEI